MLSCLIFEEKNMRFYLLFFILLSLPSFVSAQINPAYQDSFCKTLALALSSVERGMPDSLLVSVLPTDVSNIGKVAVQRQLPGGARMDSIEWQKGRIVFHSVLLSFELQTESRLKIYSYLKNLLTACLPDWRLSESRPNTQTQVPVLMLTSSSKKVQASLSAVMQGQVTQFKLRVE